MMGLLTEDKLHYLFILQKKGDIVKTKGNGKR